MRRIPQLGLSCYKQNHINLMSPFNTLESTGSRISRKARIEKRKIEIRGPRANQKVLKNETGP